MSKSQPPPALLEGGLYSSMEAQSAESPSQKLAHVKVWLSSLAEAVAWIVCAAVMGPNFYKTSYHPINEILKAGPSDRNALTVQWSKGKTAELQFVGLTAGLVAAVVSAGFSWPAFVNAPDICKACWYSALFTNLAAVTIATNQFITLQRLRSLRGFESIVRTMLGTSKLDSRDQARSLEGELPKTTEVATVHADSRHKDGAGHHLPSFEAWEHSRKLGVYIWLLPSLMLRIAIYLFAMGMLALLWMEPQSTAKEKRRRIAIVSSVFFCLALFSHMFSMLWLSRHATPIKVEGMVEPKTKRDKVLQVARSMTFPSLQRMRSRQTDVEMGRSE